MLDKDGIPMLPQRLLLHAGHISAGEVFVEKLDHESSGVSIDSYHEESETAHEPRYSLFRASNSNYKSNLSLGPDLTWVRVG